MGRVARFDHNGYSDGDSQVALISKVVIRIFIRLESSCGSLIAQRRWGRSVEVGGSRTGQARRQHAAATVVAEKDAGSGVERAREDGGTIGRSVCFVAIW